MPEGDNENLKADGRVGSLSGQANDNERVKQRQDPYQPYDSDR
ncbi:MAG: hypothetical protein WBX25_30375 [Rhodomicrobium sp.]